MMTHRRRKLIGGVLCTLVGITTAVSVITLVCIVVVMVAKGGGASPFSQRTAGIL